jgi:hypothetical protein
MKYLLKNNLFLVSFLLLNSCSSNNTPFKIEKTILADSTVKCGVQEVLDNKENLKKISEDIINAYFNTIHKEVGRKYWDTFILEKDQCYRTGVLLSTTGELLINIMSSDVNELIIECTNYPVQFAFFGGLVDFHRPKIHKYFIEKKHVDIYDKVKPIMGIVDAAPVYYTSSEKSKPGAICYEYPKIYSLTKNACVVLYVLKITIEKDLTPVITNYIDGILVINGAENFEWLNKNAKKIGKGVASGEIKNLIIDSPAFKEVLLDKKFNKMAQEIIVKKDRSEKDPDYEYLTWQFMQDINKLAQDAEKEGFDSTYIDELKKDVRTKLHSGVFLWYYSSLSGFMWQWIFINSILFIILVIILVLMKINFLNINKFTAPFIKYNKIIQNIPFTILIAVNGWILYEKLPESLGIKYGIVPSIIFIGCCIVNILIYFESNKIKNR